MQTIHPNVRISAGDLELFCRRWKISRLELFGSAVREDFHPDSDVDVLVTFDADAAWTFRDDLRMEREFAQLLGRDVDMVERRLVEASPNWVRRRRILSSAQLLYAA